MSNASSNYKTIKLNLNLKELTRSFLYVILLTWGYIICPSESSASNNNVMNAVNGQTRQIKEMNKKIDRLEKQVKSLNSELSRLKNRAVETESRSITKSYEDEEFDQKDSTQIQKSSNSEKKLSDRNSQTLDSSLRSEDASAAVVAAKRKNQNSEDLSEENDAETGAETDNEQQLSKIPKTVINDGQMSKNTETSNSIKVNISDDKLEYDAALSLIKDGKFKEAEEKFADFMRNYPESSLQSNALFWHAESFYNLKSYNKAALEYLNCYKRYPTGPKAADSLLKLAYSLSALNKNKEACNMLGKLEKEFPNRSNNLMVRSKEAKVKMKCSVTEEEN